MGCREVFEKTTSVSRLIESGDVFWCEVDQSYKSFDQELHNWIDGAWTMFCHQEKAHHAERSYNQMAESQLAQANTRFQELNQELKQKIYKFEGLLKDLEFGEYGDLGDEAGLQALAFDIKRILQ